ncbi:MAG: secondary thiamine-phosphate synthase enzyme YjbQ, partial [Promethearchaeota archaeon]
MFLETYNYSLKTSRREEFIQITQDIDGILKKSGAKSGWVKIFCPHTTAALTINQNANPDVVHDIGTLLHNKVNNQRMLNVEGNSDAHFKSSMFGVFLEIPFENG